MQARGGKEQLVQQPPAEGQSDAPLQPAANTAAAVTASASNGSTAFSAATAAAVAAVSAVAADKLDGPLSNSDDDDDLLIEEDLEAFEGVFDD